MQELGGLMKAAEIRSLYETDYYTWTQETARLLRSGRMDEIDREALAEEVEDLGKSEKRALASQFKRLHAHLLKWAFTQKSGHENSWKASIEDSRSEIEKLLSENPGLKSQTAEIFRTSYRGGVLLAVEESNQLESIFPKSCPWTIETALAPQFLPENKRPPQKGLSF